MQDNSAHNGDKSASLTRQVASMVNDVTIKSVYCINEQHRINWTELSSDIDWKSKHQLIDSCGHICQSNKS